MKTIILATDFSPNADRAAYFAGQLASDQNAKLILLHAYQGWPDNPAQRMARLTDIPLLAVV